VLDDPQHELSTVLFGKPSVGRRFYMCLDIWYAALPPDNAYYLRTDLHSWHAQVAFSVMLTKRAYDNVLGMRLSAGRRATVLTAIRGLTLESKEAGHDRGSQ